jgi:hemolysin III
VNAEERVEQEDSNLSGTDHSPIASEHRSCYTRREERIHAVTHGLGLLVSVIGLVVLVSTAWTRGGARHVIGCGIFGISMVLVYGASTIYHSLHEPGSKRIFQVADHIAIYLLIAGTYTPFLLVNMWGSGGWNFLLCVWGLAAIGIIMELVRKSVTRRSSLALYLVMGWSIVFWLGPFVAALDPRGILLLVLGGVTYSIGVIFYLWDRLPYNHAIWHGFVMGGNALHFSCVFAFVIP